MRHFPIFLELHGRRGLVLGEGPVADRKAAMLARAGAELRRASRFAPGLLDGCAIAVGAEAPEPDLLALSAAARSRGIPVNVVDRPALCSFIMPALIDRDPVTVAVGTGGAAPVLARIIRSRIEALLPPGLGRLATLALEFREDIRTRFPDLARRRQLIERLFGGRVASLALAGEEAAARSAVVEEIAAAQAHTMPAGIVHFIAAGSSEADLLTLRAQRLLGEADVIVHDRGVGGALLDMARRDADRIRVDETGADPTDPENGAAALLVGLARAGKVVVRFVDGRSSDSGAGKEAAVLAAAGISHDAA